MTDDSSRQPNMLAVYRREFLGGQTRESAKAKWGAAFDDKAWDTVEKIGRADPEELAARPHPRDIFKREYDHPRPRNEALDKWGAHFEAMVERDLARMKTHKGKFRAFRGLPSSPDSPHMDGPDLDRE